MKTKPRTTGIDTLAGECIAVRLRMLNRTITNIYDEALRPLGLKVSQLNLLVATAKMGVARPAEVCQRLHLEVSTLSRNLERMKANGWLEVVEDEDRRAQPFRLTSAGKRLLDQAIPKWRTAQKKAHKILGDDGLALLDAAVRRIPK